MTRTSKNRIAGLVASFWKGRRAISRATRRGGSLRCRVGVDQLESRTLLTGTWAPLTKPAGCHWDNAPAVRRLDHGQQRRQLVQADARRLGQLRQRDVDHAGLDALLAALLRLRRPAGRPGLRGRRRVLESRGATPTRPRCTTRSRTPGRTSRASP